MSAIKAFLTRLLLELERDFHTFRKLKRFRNKRPYEIVPYLSYGTPRKLFVRGRVIEDKGIEFATPDASRWRNFKATYKRFVSDKVAGARLQVRYQGAEAEVRTDAKGYFSAHLELPEALEPGWCPISYTLLEPGRKGVEPARAEGYVLIPDPAAQYGVVSDMDDTVVQTDVTRWVRVLGAVLFGNAYTRLPFKGVSAFYRALEAGTAGGKNPLFYVSSSPWNLYDLLLEFLAVSKIPLGPLSLRAWRSGAGELFPAEHGEFKQQEIRRILDTFPDLPFILIGDSGEADPEIYDDIVRLYPGRILGVYIRNVSGLVRRGSVEQLGEHVAAAGSQLVLADDTLEAAKHAVAQGWIEAHALAEIRTQRERDRAFIDTIDETLEATFAPEAGFSRVHTRHDAEVDVELNK